MIKGRILTFDKRFGTEMSYFLSSINCANATYKGSQIKVDGKMTDNLEIQFNYCKSSNEYKKFLSKKYDNAKDEFEITLAETHNKYDKISLITDIISDVSSFLKFLKKNTDGSFTHKLFQFSNLSTDKKNKLKTIDESFCQDYYYWMHHYSNKMYDFLENQLKNNRVTNQDEFPIPPSLIQNENNSTKENPLEYFEYLFKRNGITKLRNNFIHYYDYNESADYKYDKESETMTYYIREDVTGKWIETKKTFNDYYSSRLYNEFRISRKFIDDYINEQKKESAITVYVKLNLIKLKNLLIAIERDKEAQKYENSHKPINGLIQFFQENYFDFLPNKKVEEKSDSISTKTTTKYYFKIKAGASKKNKAKSLFDALEKGKYVDITSKNDFINAFTGYEPTSKINWIGPFGDLKTLIIHCIQSESLEKTPNKWVITSEIFLSKGINFDSRKIASTKKTLSHNKIIKLANRALN